MLNDSPIAHRHARQGGVALIEGLIAILIFSLGILGLIGLQASSVRAVTEAKTRVDASLIANQRIAQIWVDVANIAAYAEAGTPIPSLPEGQRTTAVTNIVITSGQVTGGQVTVTVTWQMPGEVSTNSFVAIAQVNTNPA